MTTQATNDRAGRRTCVPFRFPIEADRALRPAGSRKKDIQQRISAALSDMDLLMSIEAGTIVHSSETLQTSAKLTHEVHEQLKATAKLKKMSMNELAACAIIKKFG